jgi:hypothetical protein
MNSRLYLVDPATIREFLLSLAETDVGKRILRPRNFKDFLDTRRLMMSRDFRKILANREYAKALKHSERRQKLFSKNKPQPKLKKSSRRFHI